MTALRTLSKQASDTAHEAARWVCAGNMDREADRAAYRAAKARLAAMLPDGADAGAIISEAVRWQMREAIACVLADIPITQGRAATSLTSGGRES